MLWLGLVNSILIFGLDVAVETLVVGAFPGCWLVAR